MNGVWHLRWSDDGGVGGDDDAEDREGLMAVRAAVLSAWGGDVVRERSRDGGDGERDGGDDVTVSLTPDGFAAVDVAVALA